MYSSRVRGCRCLPKAMGVPAKMKMTEWTLCMCTIFCITSFNGAIPLESIGAARRWWGRKDGVGVKGAA